MATPENNENSAVHAVWFRGFPRVPGVFGVSGHFEQPSPSPSPSPSSSPILGSEGSGQGEAGSNIYKGPSFPFAAHIAPETRDKHSESV